jgi:hypothetical protein
MCQQSAVQTLTDQNEQRNEGRGIRPYQITVTHPPPGINIQCNDPLIADGTTLGNETVVSARIVTGNSPDIMGAPVMPPPNWAYQFMNVPNGVPLALVVDGISPDGPIRKIVPFQCGQ